MKKRTTLAFTVLLMAALLLMPAGPAGAGAIRHEVTGYEYDCFTGLVKAWEQGNVLHLRGVGHTNVNVSDTPELNGINTTVADADINLKTGVTVIRGTMSLQPDGIAGTWEGSWTFIYNPGIRGSGHAVARGAGALAGKMLFLELYDAEPDGNLETACQGLGDPEGYARSEGYILETGAP